MNAMMFYVLSIYFPELTHTYTHTGKGNECIEMPKLTSDICAQAVYRSPGTSFQLTE